MVARMRRYVPLYAAVGVMLLAACPGSAGFTVIQVPVFSGAQILFSASGFSALPVVVPGFGTLSSVIIRPVIIVQPTIIIAPRHVVLLSPIVPATVPFLPFAPAVLPAVPSLVDLSGLRAIDEEPLGNIVRAPELFDHRLVNITGIIADLHRFVDARGDEGTLLRLQRDWKSVNVLARGHVQVPAGVVVRATGVFYSAGDMQTAPMPNVLAALVVSTP